MSRRFLLAAFVLLELGATALPAPAVLTFDLAPYGGSSTSLALQPNGLPAVGTGGSRARYGQFDGGTWLFSTVETGQTSDVSLAFLPSGQPALAYIRTATHELHYARFDGTAWQITTAASNAYELGARNLAILPSGNPALIYLDTSYQTVYASYDGAAWQYTVLGPMTYCRPSMAILPSGAPAIAYRGSGGLTYAWLEGETWHTSAVGVSAGWGVSLAILPSGGPALAYDGWDYWAGQYLCFAWLVGEQWYVAWVAPGGSACSLAIGADGEPAVGHLDPGTNTMYYSWHVGEAWQTQLVQPTCWSETTGLVCLAPGDLLLSYTLDDYGSPLGLAAICGSPVSTYANPTSGNDAWDGLTPEWDGTHGPKATIGAAMGLAWYLDEVVLAPSTYTGPGNRDLSFYGRQITVRGQDPNDPPTVAATVIDIAASPEDRHRAFTFSGGEGPEAALRGLTVRNGCGPLTPHVNTPSYLLPTGGAVFGRTASPTIADCVFEGNEAEYGGAVHFDAPNGQFSNPRVLRCAFEGNHVVPTSLGAAPSGGGMACWNGTAIITDCDFVGNTAQYSGYDWICMSGALDVWGSPATVSRCIFVGNSADPQGVGGAVTTFGNVEIDNCVFAGNYASGYPPYFYDVGGGLAVWDGETSATSCVFSGNVSGINGGAVSADYGCNLAIRNSTFVGNIAAAGEGDAIKGNYPAAILANNIIWNGADWWYGSPDPIVTYSDVQGGWSGTGNIDADPLFVDADGPDGIPGTADDDLHLQPLSPCVNTGDPAYDPGPDAVDIDGEPRLQQCRVDMGADEVSELIDCNANGVADSCEFEFAVAFPLDSNPGWAVSGQWAFGQPTGGGSYNHDPVAGHTGAFVYGYNLNGDYTNDMGVRYLTTAPVDCTGVSNVELRFWRWLGVQAGPQDNATVRVSNDGVSWTTVWDNYGQLIADTAWVEQVLDVSAVADGRAAVYVQWGMGPTDGSITYPGWNLDDVELRGTRDCNGNRVLDECEVLVDCNGNGILDDCDIASGFSQDCNGNGVPDDCESFNDCNANGIPDECDIASGVSQDCQENGIPDECEPFDDCNGNGVYDACDIHFGTSPDCNGNGVPDECDVLSGQSADCDDNGVPDECQPDCNGNGVADSCDIASGTSQDCQENGVPDECEPFVDCNGNGVYDACDIHFGSSTDCNLNGVPDECDIAGGQSPDCNANGLPDECDVASGFSMDCNANGVPDECDVAGGTSPDCNSNGIPDECDVVNDDCNSNGVPDSCDIANGTSPDVNGNGIPDECDLCIGDLNCDGVIDFNDINPFVLLVTNIWSWQAKYPGCDPRQGDINCNGYYGQGQFDDINPFVQLMTQCTTGCACPGPIGCP